VLPEQQRNAAPATALTVPAPNLMVNIGELTKMPLTVTVSYFPRSFYKNFNHKKSEELIDPTLTITFVWF
jgi:hypothetical protein